MSELIDIMIERVQMAAESVVGADVEMPTGLDSLDAAIGGLRPGDLILLTGAPGSGKSSLLLQLLAAGGQLVADDLVRLDRRGEALQVTAAGAPGLIELRGNGIFRTSTTAGVQVSLCVELNAGPAAERLPETAVTRVARRK